MLELMVTLSVLEGVLVLGALAIYLLLILRALIRVERVFANISFGVRAIETHANTIPPSVQAINETLPEVAPALGGLMRRAAREGR